MDKKRQRWNHLFLLLSSVGFVFGCTPTSSIKRDSTTEKRVERTSGTASENELQSYHEIETLYSKLMFEEAEIKVRAFKTQFPESSLLHGIENFKGLAWLQKKKPVFAIPHFEKAIRLSRSDYSYKSYYLYNLASAQYEAQKTDDAQSTLSEIDIPALDQGNRVKVYYLKANVFEKKGLPAEAVRQLLSAGRFISDLDTEESRTVFNHYLDKSLGALSEPTVLEALFHEFEESPIADTVLFRLANLELATQRSGMAEGHLRLLMARFPKSPLYGKASELLSNLREKTATDSRAVGVLLPLSGKFAKFGSKSLQGLELAFQIFGSEEGGPYNLIVEDSGDDPAQATSALERLVFKHHVVAVIGPMLSKGIEQISQKAQELGVPLLSLARRETINSDFVFQAGLTQQMQAHEIARYSIEKMGVKKFAILFPNDKMGQEISQTFWDSVEALGGKVVGFESYSPGETDFRQPVDKLAGLYYPAARQREIDQLTKDRETNNIKKRTRRTEQYFTLKPIVDFDAVFMPDEAKVAGQIIPTFAYRDVENIRFLGTAAWNSPDFLSRTQSYAENALFVEAFYGEGSSGTAKQFVEKYRKVFEQEPGSIEAIAYDAGSLLYHTLQATPDLSRSELRDKLRAVRGFSGVTGKLTYRDGQFFRNLKLITVKNGKFNEVN